MDGVTNEVPVPNEVPPDATEYQLTTAPKELVGLTVTARVTEPESQREAGVPEEIDGAKVTIVAATAVLGLEDKQPFELTA
jgi:hypothetical protein